MASTCLSSALRLVTRDFPDNTLDAFTVAISFGTGGINDPAITTGATALEDFLAGYPSTGSLLVGSAYRVFSWENYAAFVQDDWRITSRITLNLGLRWEAQPAITAQGNHMGNFDPSAPEGLRQQTSGHPVYNGDNNAFGTAIGIGVGCHRQGNYCCQGRWHIMTGEGPQLSSLINLGVYSHRICALCGEWNRNCQVPATLPPAPRLSTTLISHGP